LEAAYNELRAVQDRVGSGVTLNVETAIMLEEYAKASFETTSSGSDSIEAKATAMLGIVAGATSAFGVFGIAKDGKPITLTPLLFAAFAFIVLAIIALMYVLRAKDLTVTDVGPYASAKTVSADNRAAMALLVAQRYREAQGQLSRAVAGEPNALAIAYGSVAVAAALIFLNALAVSNDVHNGPSGSQKAWVAPSVLSPSRCAPSMPKAAPKPCAVIKNPKG
jgi:hypothetical protein